MFRKTSMALAATLILGSASLALAEDSSSSFNTNIYPQASRQAVQPTLTTRDVALPLASTGTPAADQWMNRASQVRDGGGN